MIEAYPELNYVSDSDYSPENKGLHYRFFDCMVDPESKTLSVRRLHLLLPLASNRRRSIRRRTIQPDPPRRKSVSRLVCRIPANQCCQCGLCPRRHHYAPRAGCAIARQSARRRIRFGRQAGGTLLILPVCHHITPIVFFSDGHKAV